MCIMCGIMHFISCLLTKWWRVRPEPVLRAYDARLADQSVPIVAAECDQSANGQATLAEAGAPNASIKRRNWHHALNDYKAGKRKEKRGDRGGRRKKGMEDSKSQWHVRH